MSDGADLETVLRSIPWTQGHTSTFQAQQGKKIITVETPVYAPPTMMIDQRLQIGIYLPSDRLEYVPIGLAQTRNFCTSYYHFTKKRRWDVTEEPEVDLLYLPLEKLSLQMDVQNRNGEFLKQSPFQVYTIQGLEYPFPFVLLEEENVEGMEIHIPYQNNWQALAWNHQKIRDIEPWDKYVDQLLNGTYVEQFLENPEDSITTVNASLKKYSIPMAEATHLPLVETEIDWSDPTSIHKSLDTVMEGQPEGKKSFSVEVSDYVTGASRGKLHLHPVLLLLGPTGVGKTLMASHISKKTNLPKASANLQNNSGTGYVGGSITDVFYTIQQQSKEESPFGYVLYNELDKLASDNDLNSWGPQLQNELLSILEKGEVFLDDKKNNSKENNNRGYFTTENLFFILTGAFVGLEKIIGARLGLTRTIGFGMQQNKKAEPEDEYALLKQVTDEDLMEYGLKPELVGRISSTIVLDSLTEKDLKNILQKPSMSPITGHRTQLQLRGYDLEVEDEALEQMAKACPTQTGARAIKGICSRVFKDIKYGPDKFARDKTIYLTAELVEDLLNKKVYK